jgi:hypothetical protein
LLTLVMCSSNLSVMNLIFAQPLLKGIASAFTRHLKPSPAGKLRRLAVHTRKCNVLPWKTLIRFPPTQTDRWAEPAGSARRTVAVIVAGIGENQGALFAYLVLVDSVCLGICFFSFLSSL